MTRSSIPLRHVLFGALFAASLAFGSAQAFATPQARVGIGVTCNFYSLPDHDLDYCGSACYQAGYAYGVCTSNGYCDCRRRPPAIPEGQD